MNLAQSFNHFRKINGSDIDNIKRLFTGCRAGSTARSAAELTGVNRNTAILFFHKLRETIHEEIVSDEPPMMSGEIEVDESYFGGKRKGKRGRGAAGKVPVFGLLKRNGYVHAKIIPNAASATLVPIIREKVRPHSMFHVFGLAPPSSRRDRFSTDNR